MRKLYDSNLNTRARPLHKVACRSDDEPPWHPDIVAWEAVSVTIAQELTSVSRGVEWPAASPFDVLRLLEPLDIRRGHARFVELHKKAGSTDCRLGEKMN
jgi:hypothetical protein